MSSGSRKVSAEERERRVQLPLARQMVESARRLIGERGLAGTSTVAIQRATPGRRRPGSSAATGSIFYYFGSRERVLIEVLRADVEHRLELLGAALKPARTFDELIAALAAAVETFVAEEPGSHVLLTDLAGEGLRNPALAEAQAEAYRHWRAEVAAMLRDAQDRGVVTFGVDVTALAELLTAVGQGLAIQEFTDREWDRKPAQRLARDLLRLAAQRPESER